MKYISCCYLLLSLPQSRAGLNKFNSWNVEKVCLCFLCSSLFFFRSLSFWLTELRHAHTPFFTNGKSFKKDFNTSRDWEDDYKTHMQRASDKDFDPRKRKWNERNRTEWEHSNGFVPKFVIEIKLRINATLYYTCTMNMNRDRERRAGRQAHTSCTRYWKLNSVHDDESIQNNTKIRYAFDINIIRWYLRAGCVYSMSSWYYLSLLLLILFVAYQRCSRPENVYALSTLFAYTGCMYVL